MSRNDTLSHYEKLMQLAPETTNEDIRELYSVWSHTYDKVRPVSYVALSSNLIQTNLIERI
jgi:hypothetical protein